MASCRTVRKTQDGQTSQTQAELRSDSSASRSLTSLSQRQDTLTSELEGYATYLFQPLPDGSLQITERYGRRKRRTGSSHTRAESHGKDSANVVRTASERHSDQSQTEVASKPPSVAAILAIWVAGCILLSGMGYLLVKLQNKQTR